jgi:cysteine desulfurase
VPEVYLDHAATSPLRRVAVEAYLTAAAVTGNASATHRAGRAARGVAENARQEVADSLGCHPEDVIFTSGGTEADNLGLFGLFRARHGDDPRRRRILVTAVEHSAVTGTAAALQAREDAIVDVLPVGTDGRVDPDRVDAALAAGPGSVALVACIWAGNEVGTVQPVAEVVAAAHRAGVPVHVDAVQAVGTLPVDVVALGADTVAVSGHKVGGPIRSGALLVRPGTVLEPLLHGGGHERGLRPGTLDVPGFAGFAAALVEAVHARPVEAVRLGALRDRLLGGVVAAVPGARPTAPDAPRLPSIAHLTFPRCDGESLLFLLDDAGIAASAGSACHAGLLRPSPVLLAMGRPSAEARTGVRFSFGHTSTDGDVDAVLAVIGEVALRAEAAAGVAA